MPPQIAVRADASRGESLKLLDFETQIQKQYPDFRAWMLEQAIVHFRQPSVDAEYDRLAESGCRPGQTDYPAARAKLLERFVQDSRNEALLAFGAGKLNAVWDAYNAHRYVIPHVRARQDEILSIASDVFSPSASNDSVKHTPKKTKTRALSKALAGPRSDSRVSSQTRLRFSNEAQSVLDLNDTEQELALRISMVEDQHLNQFDYVLRDEYYLIELGLPMGHERNVRKARWLLEKTRGNGIPDDDLIIALREFLEQM